MAQNPQLDPADRIAIEDLLTAVSFAVDDRDVETFPTLLTDDVFFDLGFGDLNGREAVAATFAERAEDRSYVSRHLWANLKVLSVDGNSVDLRSVFATFAVTDVGNANNRVWRCGDYFDTVRKGDDGIWKLAARRLDLALPD